MISGFIEITGEFACIHDPSKCEIKSIENNRLIYFYFVEICPPMTFSPYFNELTPSSPLDIINHNPAQI